MDAYFIGATDDVLRRSKTRRSSKPLIVFIASTGSGTGTVWLDKYIVHSVIHILRICTSFITIRRHLSVVLIRECTINRLIILYLAVQVQSVQSTFGRHTLFCLCFVFCVYGSVSQSVTPVCCLWRDRSECSTNIFLWIRPPAILSGHTSSVP